MSATHSYSNLNSNLILMIQSHSNVTEASTFLSGIIAISIIGKHFRLTNPEEVIMAVN